MPKLQESQNRYFITLPVQLVRAKGWKKGDRIKVKLDQKGRLLLEKSSIKL